MKHLGIAGLLIAASVCTAGGAAEATPTKKKPAAAAAPATPPATMPATTANPTPTPTLPVFSFQGEDTETQYAKSGSDCTAAKESTEKEQIISCEKENVTIAGTQLISLLKKYNNGKLFMLFGMMKSVNYVDLSRALTEKYGTPKIETKTEIVRGNSVDEETLKWAFKGSEMSLNSGGTSSVAILYFHCDVNVPSVMKPKVDF